MATNDTLLNLELPGIKKLKSGKVREIFDLGDSFLFVASDRISAFDCVMPNGIPRKGEVLTQISHFWFDQTETLVPNHRLVKAGESFNVPALAHIPADLKASLAKRTMHSTARGCAFLTIIARLASAAFVSAGMCASAGTLNDSPAFTSR